MNITLYEVPFVIYSRYKRMRKQGIRESICLIILSQLNNISKDDMKEIIHQEAHKEKQLGFMAYVDTYRQLLGGPEKQKYMYELKTEKI